MKSIIIELSTIFENVKLANVFKKTIKKIGIRNSNLLYLHHNSKRIAGTIRDFRTTKFAQKDGLLAAFFELFLCSNVTK